LDTRKRHIAYLIHRTTNPAEHYIAVTSDLKRRLTEHSFGRSPHTSKFRDWRLTAAVWFDDESGRWISNDISRLAREELSRKGEIIDLGRARRGAGAGSSEWVSSSGSVRRREGRSGAVKEQAGIE